jgi:hypothetical protein
LTAQIRLRAERGRRDRGNVAVAHLRGVALVSFFP